MPTVDAIRRPLGRVDAVDAAEFLVTGKQAHYLFTVKANQPTFLAHCGSLAWPTSPCWTAPATLAPDGGGP
jgi:hypothetical protein